MIACWTATVAPAAARSASLRAHPACSAGGSDDVLTLDEMRLRFVDVKRHFATSESGELSESDLCRNMLCTRLDDLRLARARVGESEHHGRGVFATRDIAEGELITFFPGDALMLWQDAGKRDHGLFFGKHVPKEARGAGSVDELRRDYELTVDATRTIVGDPQRADDPAYIGHMCNDGAACVTLDARAHYAVETARACNAAFFPVEGCHMWTKAIRPIAEGDEVLVSYGEGYWLSRNGLVAPTPAPGAGLPGLRLSSRAPSSGKAKGGKRSAARKASRPAKSGRGDPPPKRGFG